MAVRAITCLLIALACVAAPSTAQDAVQRAGRQARKVRPDAGARIAAAGAVLEIEAGTVEAETEIEVSPLAGAEVATLDPGMTNVTGGGHGYRFGPHGSHFRKALRLTLPYDDRLLPAGMTTDDVRVGSPGTELEFAL